MADAYRTRLEERLKKVLAEFQVALDPADLVREVSLFAERSDISEEIVRLRSHLEQFDAIMAAAGECGPETRIPHPGNVPRGQHDRLEGQRRGDHQRRDRDQDGHRADPRNDPKHRMSERDNDAARCGRLVVVSGPSGAGKTTVLERRLPALPGAAGARAFGHDPAPAARRNRRRRLPLPHARRSSQAAAATGEFLECFEVFGQGYWYGTLRSEVTAGLKAGKVGRA